MAKTKKNAEAAETETDEDSEASAPKRKLPVKLIAMGLGGLVVLGGAIKPGSPASRSGTATAA